MCGVIQFLQLSFLSCISKNRSDKRNRCPFLDRLDRRYSIFAFYLHCVVTLIDSKKTAVVASAMFYAKQMLCGSANGTYAYNIGLRIICVREDDPGIRVRSSDLFETAPQGCCLISNLAHLDSFVFGSCGGFQEKRT